MGIEMIFIMLFAVSLLTTLTTEGIKKLTNKKMPNNIIAVITSAVLSIVIVVLYCVYRNIPFTTQIVIETISLVYLSFLVATNGYDKVLQVIKQIKEKASK